MTDVSVRYNPRCGTLIYLQFGLRLLLFTFFYHDSRPLVLVHCGCGVWQPARPPQRRARARGLFIPKYYTNTSFLRHAGKPGSQRREFQSFSKPLSHFSQTQSPTRLLHVYGLR